jgi:hypothetical protein
MKFNPQTYKPIDYRQWILGDQARQGVNIKRLDILTPDELNIWNLSQQYQDARNDPGHGEMATYLAIKLLPYYPKAIREISVPTTELHDNGFFGEDPNAWQKAVEEAQKAGNLKSLNDDAKRMPHQLKGAEMALKIFQKADYPRQEYRQKSAEIIKDHDTRHNPTTPSGRLMWDADYPWRVTLPCNQIYLFDKGITNPYEIIKRAEDSCLNTEPPHNLKGIAKKIAKIELANTIYFKYEIQKDSEIPEEFPDQATKALQQNYSKELRIVQKFYKSNPL